MNQTTNATMWYVNHEAEKVRSSCHSAASRMRHSRTLRELVHAKDSVHVQSYLRSIVHGDLATVNRTFETCAAKMVDEQLATVAALPMSERKGRIHVLREREWNFLRGNSPRLYHHVEVECAKLLRDPPAPKT